MILPFFSRQPEHEIFWESVSISFNGLIKDPGLYLI